MRRPHAHLSFVAALVFAFCWSTAPAYAQWSTVAGDAMVSESNSDESSNSDSSQSDSSQSDSSQSDSSQSDSSQSDSGDSSQSDSDESSDSGDSQSDSGESSQSDSGGSDSDSSQSNSAETSESRSGDSSQSDIGETSASNSEDSSESDSNSELPAPPPDPDPQDPEGAQTNAFGIAIFVTVVGVTVAGAVWLTVRSFDDSGDAQALALYLRQNQVAVEADLSRGSGPVVRDFAALFDIQPNKLTEFGELLRQLYPELRQAMNQLRRDPKSGAHTFVATLTTAMCSSPELWQSTRCSTSPIGHVGLAN